MLSHESIRLHISDTRQLALAELAHCKVSLFYVKLCWESFETHTIWVTDPGSEAGIQHKHFLVAHQWCKVCFQGKIKHMSHIQHQHDRWSRKENATGHQIRSHSSHSSVHHRVLPCSRPQALRCAVSVCVIRPPQTHIPVSTTNSFMLQGLKVSQHHPPHPVLFVLSLTTSPASVSLWSPTW